MLRDNVRAINLMKKMGFVVHYLQDGTAKGDLNLVEESEQAPLEEPSVVGVPIVPAPVPVQEEKTAETSPEALAS
jgi:hypothetical protein